MDIQEKHLLEETAELARENHKILKKLRRAQVWGRVMHVLYWVVIIGSAVGAYYFIQPYIDVLGGAYRGLRENIQAVQDFGSQLPGLGGILQERDGEE